MTIIVINIRIARLASEFWNSAAAPWNCPLTVSGSRLSATLFTRVSALPSAAPGARPNETVTDGSCP
jgi:hypothetical protein